MDEFVTSEPKPSPSKILRQAYEALLLPCIDPLYGTAFRMTGDRQAAEDLVQEACLKAYANFRQFEDGTNFKAWIFRIMTNAFIDSRRRDSRMILPFTSGAEPEAVTSTGHGLQSPQTTAPEVHILYREFKSEALKAMAELPTETRAVVALALLEEFTYREISEAVGCSVGTVRSRLNRGREQLRKALREYVPEPVSRPSRAVHAKKDET
ncbi:MAG TPA: RNA polymerase subunit sigma-24 [Rhodospirillaceae bacterium]|nr:RNA polymerase subunit sigma-24 [Rhodospirillaceae bacterium]HAA90901.1 RNA polymerase subunit sigma-24 [Rhodospirillaceae bacterium]HAT34410.1 RNA polymerase subunit sigma-24 [Rhodospirillaceae bacterium]